MVESHSFLWLKRLSLIAPPNRIDLKVAFVHDKCHDSNAIKLENKTAPNKMRQNKTHRVGLHLTPRTNSSTKRKKVNYEGNDYLQKTHDNWTKAKERQGPCLQTSEIKNVSRPCKRRAFCGCHGKKLQIHDTICFTIADKKNNKLWNKTWRAESMVLRCSSDLCHEQYSN